jgi:3-deoxy-D-manno-octulosonate 8-phosphate phosphatase (KDO 8-P phosphatase)
MSGPDAALGKRLARVRLLVFDVDGVLTDGSLGGGEPRSRRWNVKDGFGIYLALRGGLGVALCSGNDHAEIRERAKRLRIEHLRLGRLDKGEAVRELLSELGLERGEALFVGDDIFDLPGVRAAGLGACPSDAAAELLARCDWRLTAAGGRGAVREVIEGVLRARGEWDAVVAPFLGDEGEPDRPDEESFRG